MKYRMGGAGPGNLVNPVKDSEGSWENKKE